MHPHVQLSRVYLVSTLVSTLDVTHLIKRERGYKNYVLLWAGRNGLPPTPDTLQLGCSYHLHSSHVFLFHLGCGCAQKNK